MTSGATVVGRVASFDLLRGLCAVAVAAYHCLWWAGVADLHAVGFFGVYIFFVLSAASMVIAYAGRLGTSVSVGKFLALRFIRLAPLYAFVALYRSAFSALAPGELLATLVLNFSLLFGLSVPGSVPLVTGGWSIGVEVVFYLVFPLLLDLTKGRRARLSVLAVLALCQLLHIFVALRGAASVEEAWTDFVHPLAFAGYFGAGLVIGWALVEGAAPFRRQSVAWLFGVISFLALGLSSGPTALLTVTGPRGAFLAVLAVAVVAIFSRLEVPGIFRDFSGRLGDMSYGVYLLHPLVFSALSSRHLLGPLRVEAPLAFIIVAMGLTLFSAAVSWAYIELPLLTRLKRWVQA